MRLTPEALFRQGPLTGPLPSQIRLSPSGALASYLRPAFEAREQLQLWLADTHRATPWLLLDGDDIGVSPARETALEKAERERRRLFTQGITSYQWGANDGTILIPANGAGFLVQPRADAGRRRRRFAAGTPATVRRITPPETRQGGIRLSPRGTRLSYVRDGDLYCLELASGQERRLTEDAGGTITNGLPEFIAQEEMHRFEGYWWAPDERAIAFTRVDTEAIAKTHRHEIHAGGIDIIAQRYPFAGTANAELRLGLFEFASGKTRWLKWALAEDDYLARARFGPDGALYVQAQSRDQRRLTLRRYKNGAWQDLLEETAATWINLHNNLTFTDRRLLWTSERSGSAQLYVYDRHGGGGKLLDTGLGRVNRILGADNNWAWLTGWRRDPTTQQLFQVALDDGRCWQLTTGDAWHDGVVNPAARIALLTGTDADTPGTLEVISLGTQSSGTQSPGTQSLGTQSLGTRVNGPDSKPAPDTDAPGGGAAPSLASVDRRLIMRGDPRQGGAVKHPYHRYLDRHSPPSIGHIGTGDAALYYRLTKPSPWDAGRRYPVIVHVYGGPGVQRVRREFPPLTLQLLAQAGFGVFELDNRGSGNRDRIFEDAIRGRLGDVEVADQLAGVDFLRSLAWVDGHRIGVFGHSYGGYMALLCLARGDAFAAGVSVAPVARWELYDSHYTERYLGLPAANPDGYAASSVLPRVAAIQAPLLLIHGMADDNVLFTHTTSLMAALQEAGIQFQLMAYPGAKHALQEPAVAIHRYHCILEFFQRTLGVAGDAD